MAPRAVIQGIVLNGLWRTSVKLFPIQQKFQTPISSSRCGCNKIITNIKDFCSERRIDRHFNCSRNENTSSSPSVVSENIQEPPQETNLQTISVGERISESRGIMLMLLNAIGLRKSYYVIVRLTIERDSDGSRTEDRIGQTTNMVFGDTVIDGSGEWLTLSQKLDTYPSVRKFTAIGIGGNDFVQSMILAVESVIQHPVSQEHVKQRVSSGGKYVSVNIGPIQVVSREQVRAVYNAMRSDDRMKFFL